MKKYAMIRHEIPPSGRPMALMEVIREDLAKSWADGRDLYSEVRYPSGAGGDRVQDRDMLIEFEEIIPGRPVDAGRYLVIAQPIGKFNFFDHQFELWDFMTASSATSVINAWLGYTPILFWDGDGDAISINDDYVVKSQRRAIVFKNYRLMNKERLAGLVNFTEYHVSVPGTSQLSVFSIADEFPDGIPYARNSNYFGQHHRLVRGILLSRLVSNVRYKNHPLYEIMYAFLKRSDINDRYGDGVFYVPSRHWGSHDIHITATLEEALFFIDLTWSSSWTRGLLEAAPHDQYKRAEARFNYDPYEVLITGSDGWLPAVAAVADMLNSVLIDTTVEAILDLKRPDIG